MSLQSTLAEIQKIQPFIDEDTESGSSATLNARRGRKAQSIEQMKRLKREYKKDLLATTVFIVATGSGREEFTRIAVEKGNLFTANPEAFYVDLANRIPETLYMNKNGTQNVFDVLGRHLEDKMIELDLSEYNQLVFKAVYAQDITQKQQLVDLIKTAINSQIGSEIVGIQAVDSLTDAAIQRGHSDKITPIVLSTGDEALALSLLNDLTRLTNRVFLSVTGKASKTLRAAATDAIVLKEATEESVGQALSTMKKNLKNK